MANNTPFIFGEAGQAAPSFPSKPQQHTQPNTPNCAPPLAPLAPPTQQAAFQQNAQLPGTDMTALAGVSPDQVALIVRLLQSGALPLPPPLPGASAAPVQAATTAPSATPVQPVSARQEDVDKCKEEGEIEDAGALSTSLSRAIDAPTKDMPKGPRHATRGMQPHGASPSRRAPGVRNTLSHNRSGTANTVYMGKEGQSKDFVLAMHQAGYSYRHLAEMVDDPKPLRRMFKLLGLPVSSDHGLSDGMQPPKGPSSQARSPNALGDLTRPAAETLQKDSLAKPPAQPKPAVKADRSAYLAKLQALKAGKAGPSTDQSPLQIPTQTSVTTAAPSPTVIAPTAAAPTTASATSTPTSKAVKTELARQRLEAFKAERAAKQQANATSNAMASTVASLPVAAAQVAAPGGLGAGLHAIASRVDQQMSPVATQGTDLPPAIPQPVFSPHLPAPSRSFNGIPGLFMSSNPQKASSPASSQAVRTASQPLVQGASAQLSTLPQKRLVTDDRSRMPTPSKRLFGQSRSASEDESFIIENSDEEEEDTRMDMDTAHAAIDASMGSSRGTLPRQNSTVGFQQASTAASSGTNTPGGMTYEQKLKAIEELNRRIAEREAKRKAQEKAPVSQATAAAVASALPGISTSLCTASLPPEEQAEQATEAPFTPERPASAGAFKLKQQKEELRQRIAELENARRSVGVSIPPTGLPASAAAPVVAVPESPRGSDNVTGDSREKPKAATATPPASAAIVDTAASEDGELEDESDFDFYGDEEAIDAPQPLGGPPQVASQATTVTGITESDTVQQQFPFPSSSGPAESGLFKSDAVAVDRTVENMDVEPIDELSNAAAAAVSEGVSQPVAGATSDYARAQATSSEFDVDMDGQDSGSDESSDDGSDLNGPLEAAEPDPESLRGSDPNTLLELTDVEDDVDDIDDLDGPHELTNGEDNTSDLRESVDPANLDEANDIESSDASSTRTSDSEEYEPAPADMQADESLVPQAEQEADDLAPELQADQEAHAAMEPLDQQPHANNTTGYYTPYQSIMTKFKDYRYHPEYLKTVPSGFHSRTWNHQIDPNKPLCLTEALGGTCHDKQCGDQHFDKMAINDNMLLQQMGTKNIPARTKDEVTKWNEGLQEIIRTLKSEDVRDAASIAARIAKFRREFSGDPSRIISIR